MMILNKFTGETIAELHETDMEAVKSMLAEGAKAAELMRKLPRRDISQALNFISDELKNRSEEFARLITTETGKPLKASRQELEYASEFFRHASGAQNDSHGEAESLDAESPGSGVLAFSMQAPVGLVYSITPFSEPLGSVSREIATALSTRNAILLNPSSLAPVSSVRLQEIVQRSGFPRDSVQIVIAPGGGVVSAFPLECEEVGMVSFSGRAETALEVIRKSGIKRTSVQIGSNSSVIVWDDADLDMAAESIAEAVFSSQGQTPFRPFRIIINGNGYEYFRNRMVEIASNLKVGDPLEEDTDMGPLTEESGIDILEKEVTELVNNGAYLAFGGIARGKIFAPTILENTDGKLNSPEKEIFGPVVMLEKNDSFEDAVRIANETSRWGQSGFFTTDMNLAFAAVDRLKHSTVLLNSSPPYFAGNPVLFDQSCDVTSNTDSGNTLGKMSKRRIAIIRR